MNKSRSAFITFFPIKPDTMGSSAVVNSRFEAWPYPKKIFQISCTKINSKKIETIFIKKEKSIIQNFKFTKNDSQSLQIY